MPSPENETSSPRKSDNQKKQHGIPAYLWLVVGIFGIAMLGVVYLIMSRSNRGASVTPSPTPTNIPVANSNPDATSIAADDETGIDDSEGEADLLAGDQLEEIAREDTLIIGWGLNLQGVTNPWAVGLYGHDDGNAMMWEGLAYYLIFADKSQPWLAESIVYTKDDFTELTIILRSEAKWNDGTPITSKDVVFTLEGHLNNELLLNHADFDEFVRNIEAVDELTTVITFNKPAPRFAFEVLTLKFDTGIPIVPAHILEPLDDPTAFAGGLDMPHSGPYTTVFWDQAQKILDLREDWWAVEAGLIDPPEVKRIIVDDIFVQLAGDFGLITELFANNEMDTSTAFPPDLIAGVLELNPAVTTHTGDMPPYGYLDWWPNSLWVNTLLPPYDDVRVRRAISLAIDRDKIDDLVYESAQVATIYPFPLYPGLERFVNSNEVQALIEQYEPGKFDLEESANLMEEAGFILNSSGLWERNGETVNATILGFQFSHGHIAPVIEQMLRTAGFDASVNFSEGSLEAMTEGKPGLYIFGHGASIIDPYAAFNLFHSRFSKPLGTKTDIHYSRYNNTEFDALLDEMASLSSEDPRFHELAVQALEIYWRDQIDIPIVQWLHQIPYNQTYWTNWPTADNIGPGVNGATWHHTSMLVVTHLEKAE